MHQLSGRIRAGLARLSDAFRERHARFVARLQLEDGAWAGRQGGADLYYTSFGLRALDALGWEDPAPWRGAARYLGSCAPRDVVECAAFLESRGLAARRGGLPADAGAAACEELLLRCRVRAGFARHPGGPASTYVTFLGWLCHAHLGRLMDGVDEVATEIASRQGEDGGFRDSQEAGPSGVNPTAAGLATLQGLGALDAAAAQRAAEYLVRMQRQGSGFAAHSAAEGADLLSTFTGLFSLVMLDQARAADLSGAARFARGLARGEGGFRGSDADTEADVEYTFYGVATVGLLSAAAAGSSTPGTR